MWWVTIIQVSLFECATLLFGINLYFIKCVNNPAIEHNPLCFQVKLSYFSLIIKFL